MIPLRGIPRSVAEWGIAYKNQIVNFANFDVDARRFAPRDSP